MLKRRRVGLDGLSLCVCVKRGKSHQYKLCMQIGRFSIELNCLNCMQIQQSINCALFTSLMLPSQAPHTPLFYLNSNYTKPRSYEL